MTEPEVDLPIIYDILQKHLAAKVVVLMDYSNGTPRDSGSFIRHEVSSLRVEPSNDDARACVWLGIVTIARERGDFQVSPGYTCYGIWDMEKWKLTKVGEHLELKT
jgi:hypothetical protein